MIDRADINSVLMQMRSIRSEMQQGVGKVEAFPQPEGVKPAEHNEFGDLLKMAVDSVNNQQTEAKNLATAYEQGDPSVDLPQVMIQAQKASVSFQAMSEVRNRLVSAYEDVMNMSI